MCPSVICRCCYLTEQNQNILCNSDINRNKSLNWALMTVQLQKYCRCPSPALPTLLGCMTEPMRERSTLVSKVPKPRDSTILSSRGTQPPGTSRVNWWAEREEEGRGGEGREREEGRGGEGRGGRNRMSSTQWIHPPQEMTVILSLGTSPPSLTLHHTHTTPTPHTTPHPHHTHTTPIPSL